MPAPAIQWRLDSKLCGHSWAGHDDFHRLRTFTCTRPAGHIEEGYAGQHEDNEGHTVTVSGKWHYDPNDPYDDGK